MKKLTTQEKMKRLIEEHNKLIQEKNIEFANKFHQLADEAQMEFK